MSGSSWMDRFASPGGADGGVMTAVYALAGLVCAAVLLRSLPNTMDAPRRYVVAEDAEERRKGWKVVGKKTHPELADIPALVSEMRDAFESGITLPLENRRAALKAMLAMVTENEKAILDAVWEDLRRPTSETLYYDFLLVQGELRTLIKNLKRWTAPERVGSFSLLTFPSSQWIEKEPYGVVLAIGPFNYPFLLTAGVVAGAVAAGNNVILKPSLDVPASTRLLADLFARYVDPRVVTVAGHGIPGDGVDVMNALLAEKFDFIFFTGSTRIGSIVAQRAAAKLTPYALELGGKNPVFVTPTADLSLAAKQCVWGRTLNCGQQCIAPEYVLCHRSVLDEFTDQLRRWTRELLPDPFAEGAMGRLVGPSSSSSSASSSLSSGGGRDATGRVAALLGKIGTRGETLVCGGGFNAAQRAVEPTVVICGWDSELMLEEMFCPVLCVIPYDDLRSAAAEVRARPKPLTCYVFSSDRGEQRTILDNTTAGGVTVNGVLYHVGHSGLPFGGVGESGIGAYHGRHSIDCFQHRKPVLQKWRGMEDDGVFTDPFFVYGPHKGVKLKLLRMVGSLS